MNEKTKTNPLGAGRPKRDLSDTRIYLRLSATSMATLNRLAMKHGSTRTEIIERALELLDGGDDARPRPLKTPGAKLDAIRAILDN